MITLRDTPRNADEMNYSALWNVPAPPSGPPGAQNEIGVLVEEEETFVVSADVREHSAPDDDRGPRYPVHLKLMLRDADSSDDGRSQPVEDPEPQVVGKLVERAR